MAANSKETRLVLRLVDELTGPSKRMVGALGRLNKAMRSIQSANLGGRMVAGAMGGGRGAGGAGVLAGAAPSSRRGSMAALAASGTLAAGGRAARRTAGDTAMLSGATALGVSAAARQVYNLEKQLNISQAAGGLDLKQRNALMAEAVRLNEDYAATSAEIVGGVNELLKAGFNYEQAMGSIQGVLDSAQAMELPIADASKAITDSMVSLGLPMATMEESMASSLRMADLFARAVQATNASLEDFAVSGKYFNPVAKAFKMSAEEAYAWQMVLAKAGIRGSSAGTGLRAAPISIVAPSKKGREAFARLGLDPESFSGNKRSAASGASISAALEAAGFSTEGMEAAIDRIIADKRFGGAPGKLANAIIDQFEEELNVATGEDRGLLADTIQRALQAGTRDIDMLAFLKALKAKGATAADYKDIFGGNHASKMMAINIELYEEMLDLAMKSGGTAKQMREAMMAGIVGDVSEFTAAVESLSVAFGKSGILANAARSINAMARAINRLAESNPAFLRFTGYAAIALAVMAPLGFALSGAAAALAMIATPAGLAAAALGTFAAMNLGPITDFLSVFAKSARLAFDPALVARVREMRDAVAGLFSGGGLDEAGSDRLGQIARNLGIGFAEGVNAAYAALPSFGQVHDAIESMKQLGADLVAMGQGAWANALPKISEGLTSLRSAVTGMASAKLDAFTNLATTLTDFAERVLPVFKPAAFAGFDLVATSFNTLAAGAQAVGQFLTTAQDAIVAFATAFVENIDTKAMQSIANGLKTVFDTIQTPVRMLGDAFRTVSGYLSSTNTDITTFASTAGAKVGQGFNSIVEFLSTLGARLSAAWETVKSAFASMATYAPDFGPVINAVQSLASTLGKAADNVASAVKRIQDALAGMPKLGAALGGAVSGGGMSSGGGAVPRSAGERVGSMMPPMPRRASGGLVRRGRTYLVGENGPEPFTPGQTGYVTPNHKAFGEGSSMAIGGTSISLRQENHFHGASEQEARQAGERAAQAVLDALGNRLNRSSQISINDRPII